MAGAVEVFGANLVSAHGGLDDGSSGVCLVNMQPNGVAAIMGLQEGDFIPEVADEKVTHPQQVIAQIARAREASQQNLSLMIYSRNELWEAEFPL